jgi:hypothetical protein
MIEILFPRTKNIQEISKILEKYKNNGEFLLPRISNQYFNRVLKKIAFILLKKQMYFISM